MPDVKFDLDITDQSVSVRLVAPARTRFYALACFVGLTIILLCVLLFAPGKQNSPSIWHDRSTSVFLILVFPLFMFLSTKHYVRLAYPSSQTLRCDRSTLTVARVRWFDISNKHWDWSSFALAEVREIRYQKIARLKGGAVYGLGLRVGGKTLRLLRGLIADDAERILLVLKSFGADIPDNPVVPTELKENHQLS